MRKLPSDAFRSEIKKELLQTNNGFTDEINLICGSATSTSNENVISLNENKQIWNKIRARVFFCTKINKRCGVGALRLP